MDIRRVVCADITTDGVEFRDRTKATSGAQAIVANPPFSLAADFVRHGLKLVPKVVILERIQFPGSEDRTDLIEGGDLARELLSPTECRECTRQAGTGSGHRPRCASHGSSSSAAKCIRCWPREAIGADYRMPIFAPMTSDELRLVLVPYPILGVPSIGAARVELAVAKLGTSQQFYAFHRKVFGQRGATDGSRALEIAAGLGLNRQDLLALGDSNEITDTMKNLVNLGASLGLEATPSFIVGNLAILGYPGPNALSAIASAAGRCGKAVC